MSDTDRLYEKTGAEFRALRKAVLNSECLEGADRVDVAACIEFAAEHVWGEVRPDDEVPFLAYVVDVYDREYVTYANNVQIHDGMVEFRVEGELQSMFSVDAVRSVVRCEEE